MNQDHKEKLVPCDFRAPQSCTEELPGGKWYTRSWREGEKQAYEKQVLRKPDIDRSQ